MPDGHTCGYSSRERFRIPQETGKIPSAYRKEYRFGKGRSSTVGQATFSTFFRMNIGGR
jgi:hypothetical protein